MVVPCADRDRSRPKGRTTSTTSCPDATSKEERIGLPLSLGLGLGTAGGAPLHGGVVEIWHCDASGRYSGFPPPDPSVVCLAAPPGCPCRFPPAQAWRGLCSWTSRSSARATCPAASPRERWPAATRSPCSAPR